MFSDVAYHEHHHYNTPHLRPHPPENHLLGGFFDSLPSSPAGIPSRDLPYIYAHAQQIRQASVQPSRQYGLPVQRTNSYPCQESLRGTQARRLGGSEHMLRRKTPSGTLAAGYDGSPVDWASDTNDMKHSLGPLSSATNMYLAHQASPMGQGQYNPPAPSSSRFRSKAPREFDSLNYDRVGGSSEIDMGNMRLNWPQNHGYSPGIDSFLDQVPAHHGQVYFLSNGQQIPTVLQPTWQPCIGPTASNDPGPYGPYWPNGSFIPYRPAALRDPRYFPHPALGWASHYEDERAKYHEREQETRASALSMTSTWNEGLAHYSPFDLTGRPGQLAPSEYPFRQASRSYPSQKFEAKYKPVDVTRAHQTYSGYTTEHRTTGSTSRQIKHSQGNDSGYSTPFTPLGPYDTKQALIPDFSMQFDHSQCREKALSWAHRVYVDLLASLHQSRKASLHGRQSDRKRNLPQTNIYPRPPRQPGLDFSTQISDQNVQRNRDAQAESSYRIGCEEHVSKKPKQDYSANDYSASTTSHRRRTSISPCADSFEKPKATQQQEYSSPQNFTAPGYAASDLHNLRKSSMPGVSSNNCQNQLGSSPSTNAMAALELLTRLCQESGWLWIDGMLLGGCLAYGLGDYHKAAAWYSKILANDSSHVEAISNLAATLLSLNRREEAEQYWLRSVRLRPSFFEAVEHLIGLLCGDQRGKQAVEIIDYVERALRSGKHGEVVKGADCTSETSSEKSRSPSLCTSEASDKINFDFDGDDDNLIYGHREVDISKSHSGFGSSGFAIPGSENGRILALLHAKGNMLYALGDNSRAATAFEDAVLVAAGRRHHGIRGLIKRILTVVSHEMTAETGPARHEGACSDPILLVPEKALQTSRLVFPSHGELPGLMDVPHGMAKKAAISTTSNALLSLAKIYQDGMSSSGAPAGGPNTTAGVRDILALYYLSLAIQPSPSTANNVGILLASVQQSAHAKPCLAPSASQAPPILGVIPGSGIALALAYYNYGLNLDQRHAHLYTNLGSLLKDIGHLGPAIKMYEQAVSCDGNFDIALANLANAVKDQGRISDAIDYYRRAVAASPDFAEAVCGLANALNSVCAWTGRGGVIYDNGKRDQWHVDDQGMPIDAKGPHAVSSGWIKRVVDIVEKQLKDGKSWGRGLLHGESLGFVIQQLDAADAGAIWPPEKRRSLSTALQQWTAQSWEGAKVVRLVERATKKLGWWWYNERYIQGREYPATRYSRPQLPNTLAVPSAPTVLPFHTFTCPLSANQIRKISQRNGLRISCSTLRAPWLPTTVYRPPSPPQPYLNVGYVSSDFNNHPLAHLMQSVFGLHNPSRFRAFCYATTASDNSTHRQQIEREAPFFHDASSWSVDRLVNQIVNDGIHVLINLNGYTRGARNEVFAARPAPVQMSFMGFAGTLGAEWCDYLLADETAIPLETLRPWRRNVDVEDQLVDENHGDKPDDWIYSENIIFSKDTFFCCDHRQSAPDSHGEQLTWGEEQVRRWEMRKELFPNLADDAVILGNFNQLYKIEPTTFRGWLRILARVPKAVLWLLRFPELGEHNLKQTAVRWAGAEVASRVLFTDVAPKHHHISRARVCDLFLDTPECNAHTTAADVLWSGTPLLTLPRYKYKMCSRMAASILKGALPKTKEGDEAARDLIASSDEEYEERAVELGNGLTYSTVPLGEGSGRGRLMELRKLLYASRWSSALFDTKRWVRDIETAYVEAWRKWVAGEGGDIYL